MFNRRLSSVLDAIKSDLKLTFTGTNSVNLDDAFSHYIIEWGDNTNNSRYHDTSHSYSNTNAHVVTVKDIYENDNFFNAEYETTDGDGFRYTYSPFFTYLYNPTDDAMLSFSNFGTFLSKVEGVLPGNSRYISYTFKDNTRVTTYPKDIFKYNTYALYANGVFQGNTGLTSIPENIFYYNKDLVTCKYLFRGCTSLPSTTSAIPTGIFRNSPKIKNMAGAFYETSAFTTTPKVFDALINLEVVSYLFLKSGISSIATDLFKNNTKITRVDYAFYGCENLTTIPENLLRYNTLITNCNYLFGLCPNITGIPTNLFKYNTKMKVMDYCFHDCTKITSVPATLLSTLVDLESAVALFRATKIASIPSNLLQYNTKLEDISEMFAVNSALTAVPSGLLNTLTRLKSVRRLFANDGNIASIPSDLFRYNTLIEDFTAVFAHTGITSISADIFKYNTKAISFEDAFAYTNITAIPSNLFWFNRTASNFKSAFHDCTNLTSIPANLFHNLTTTYSNCVFRNFLKNTPLENRRPASSITPDTMFPAAWKPEEKRAAYKEIFGVDY